jgi:hypothetical protein
MLAVQLHVVAVAFPPELLVLGANLVGYVLPVLVVGIARFHSVRPQVEVDLILSRRLLVDASVLYGVEHFGNWGYIRNSIAAISSGTQSGASTSFNRVFSSFLRWYVNVAYEALAPPCPGVDGIPITAVAFVRWTGKM